MFSDALDVSVIAIYVTVADDDCSPEEIDDVVIDVDDAVVEVDNSAVEVKDTCRTFTHFEMPPTNFRLAGGDATPSSPSRSATGAILHYTVSLCQASYHTCRRNVERRPRLSLYG